MPTPLFGRLVRCSAHGPFFARLWYYRKRQNIGKQKNLTILSENRDTKILANLNFAVWLWPRLDIYIYIHIYIYMYRTSYVQVHAHGLIGNTCARFVVVVLLLAVNVYTVNSSMQRALKPSQSRQGKQLGYCVHENERERARLATETAEQRQEKLTERRCRARCSTQTADA